jgi:hypothetical protein
MPVRLSLCGTDLDRLNCHNTGLSCHVILILVCINPAFYEDQYRVYGVKCGYI